MRGEIAVREQELQMLVALTMIDKVGPKTCKNLLRRFGSAKAIFQASKQELRRVPFVGEHLSQMLGKKEIHERAEREIAQSLVRNIDIVSWKDPRYPAKLAEVEDSPLIFYCEGKLPVARQPQIAIVGTRTPSVYGRKVATEFAEYFGSRGIVVVSGLAFGIDMEAHAATMSVNGKTTAVLGHGLEQIYPRAHGQKARQIVESGGALITEFPLGTQPEAYNFPARNRIISGLCDAVVVVEATEKGGALITAKMAFEQNRDVFAVPGNLGSTTSIGCNRLIRDHVAKIACSPQDVIDGLEYLIQFQETSQSGKSKVDLSKFTDQERIVIGLLTEDAIEFDLLTFKTKMQGGDLKSILLKLELLNIVSSLPGNKYKLVG